LHYIEVSEIILLFNNQTLGIANSFINRSVSIVEQSMNLEEKRRRETKRGRVRSVDIVEERDGPTSGKWAIIKSSSCPETARDVNAVE